jgi:glucose/arabinose dehydrogenase
VSFVLPGGTPQSLITGLDVPWSVITVGGRTLISERESGRILEVTGGTTREVTTVPGVEAAGEGGLLGLTVDGRDAWLYAYESTAEGNRVVRSKITVAQGSVRLGGFDAVLTGIPSFTNHNGGRIHFGPDGMLYISTGDGGDSSRSQDLTSLGGKILRVTPEGKVPEGNPFPGSPVWSYGHRNVQGFGWAADGTMFSSEFGQSTWDELNIIEPGKNYGWPTVEGRAGDPRFVDPVQQWPTDQASPSGLAVIGGMVFMANLRGERLRAIPVSDPYDPADTKEFYLGEYGRLRDVAESPDGGLWILTNNTDGRGDPKPGDDRLLQVPLS